MIYAIAYIVIGIGTALVLRDVSAAARIGTLVAWPLYWFSFAYAHFSGFVPSKCAWCGKSVAGHAKSAWRSHYLDECATHPLKERCDKLKMWLDETDAKNTACRIRAERAEARVSYLEKELAQWNEIQKQIQRGFMRDIDRGFLRGQE
jgi:hypothetical protein